MKAVEILREP